MSTPDSSLLLSDLQRDYLEDLRQQENEWTRYNNRSHKYELP